MDCAGTYAFVGAPGLFASRRGGRAVCRAPAWRAQADGGEGGPEELRAPNDATPLRSESEVRRYGPPRRKPRRRRRGETTEPVLEWDKMDSVPLVGGVDAKREGWMDLKESVEATAREKEEEERRQRSMDKVDDSMKEKLKKEVVQPYEQNWIGVVVVAVALLVVAFKVSGGFETIPVIPVPDL